MNKRLTRSIIILIILIISIYSLKARAETQREYRRSYIATNVYKEYRVSQGDTLWDIAKEHHPEHDPRKVIYLIRKINDIDPLIHPGDRIMIPVEVK